MGNSYENSKFLKHAVVPTIILYLCLKIMTAIILIASSSLFISLKLPGGMICTFWYFINYDYIYDSSIP